MTTIGDPAFEVSAGGSAAGLGLGVAAESGSRVAESFSRANSEVFEPWPASERTEFSRRSSFVVCESFLLMIPHAVLPFVKQNQHA